MNKTIYHPASLSEVIWPQAGIGREIALVLGGSWFVALLAQVQIPLSPVPITGQTFGVLLIGALMGQRRGLLSLLTYLVQGIIGLPVFAGWSSGITKLTGPTGGYLIGFVVAAALVGWLSEQGWDRKWGTAVLAMLVGNIAIYLFGLPWLAYFVPQGQVLSLGLFPFVIGDIIKIVLAALVLPGGWALLNLKKL